MKRVEALKQLMEWLESTPDPDKAPNLKDAEAPEVDALVVEGDEEPAIEGLADEEISEDEEGAESPLAMLKKKLG